MAWGEADGHPWAEGPCTPGCPPGLSQLGRMSLGMGRDSEHRGPSPARGLRFPTRETGASSHQRLLLLQKQHLPGDPALLLRNAFRLFLNPALPPHCQGLAVPSLLVGWLWD